MMEESSQRYTPWNYEESPQQVQEPPKNKQNKRQSGLEKSATLSIRRLDSKILLEKD